MNLIMIDYETHLEISTKIINAINYFNKLENHLWLSFVNHIQGFINDYKTLLREYQQKILKWLETFDDTQTKIYNWLYENNLCIDTILDCQNYLSLNYLQDYMQTHLQKQKMSDVLDNVDRLFKNINKINKLLKELLVNKE